MSKYDFGYNLEPGSTNEWAYRNIDENMKVLEVGPAIGNLTYHLSKVKKCIVDIVEIDEEAGQKAKKFARNALIGCCEGDLNKDIWYGRINEERYDIIVVLDVLEHLQDPERILRLLKGLLNTSGKILLSIPNVAHNAVIMQLLDNRFDYTDLGLLDRTHIHFFAYDSILKMIENAGLNISVADAINKVVNDTEIDCSFLKLPIEVDYFLRTRKYGEVYQYLFELRLRNETIENCIDKNHLCESLYDTKILVNGLIENLVNIKVDPENIKVDFDLLNYHEVKSLRFVPYEGACLVSRLKASVIYDGKTEKVIPNWSSGIKVDDENWILSEENHEINYLLGNDARRFRIECSCRLLNETIHDAFEKQERIKSETANDLESRMKQLLENISEKNQKIDCLMEDIAIKDQTIVEQNNSINKQQYSISEMKETIDSITLLNERIDMELTTLKNSRWYKVVTKVKELIQLIRGGLWKK